MRVRGRDGRNQVLAIQKRMIAAVETIPGVERAAVVNNYPPLAYAAATSVNVFKRKHWRSQTLERRRRALQVRSFSALLSSRQDSLADRQSFQLARR